MFELRERSEICSTKGAPVQCYCFQKVNVEWATTVNFFYEYIQGYH